MLRAFNTCVFFCQLFLCSIFILFHRFFFRSLLSVEWQPNPFCTVYQLQRTICMHMKSHQTMRITKRRSLIPTKRDWVRVYGCVQNGIERNESVHMCAHRHRHRHRHAQWFGERDCFAFTCDLPLFNHRIMLLLIFWLLPLPCTRANM